MDFLLNFMGNNIINFKLFQYLAIDNQPNERSHAICILF